MRVFESRIQDNEKKWEIMMIRKKEQIVEVFPLPIIFHMKWVDSNPIPWTQYGPFLAGNPAIFSFHTYHGVHMDHSIDIPCGLYGISNEFTFQIHVLFHKDSMEQSMQIL